MKKLLRLSLLIVIFVVGMTFNSVAQDDFDQDEIDEKGFTETMDWIKWKVKTHGRIATKKWYISSAQLFYQKGKITYDMKKFKETKESKKIYDYNYKFDLSDIENTDIKYVNDTAVGITLNSSMDEKKIHLSGKYHLLYKDGKGNFIYDRDRNESQVTIFISLHHIGEMRAHLEHAIRILKEGSY